MNFLWRKNLAPLLRCICETPRSLGNRGSFARLADAYIRRIPRHGFMRGKRDAGPRVGVLITPWMQTSVPFFNMELAFQLQRRGCDITLIWDGGDIFSNLTWKPERDEIKRVLNVLNGRFKICDLAEASPAPHAAHDPAVEMLIRENAVRFAFGESAADDFLRKNEHAPEALRAHVRLIRGFLDKNPFDWLLIPGGIWVSSGAFCHVAGKMGLDFSTYDSGDGSLWFAHRGTAAHSSDLLSVLTAVRKVTKEDSPQWQEMIRRAQLRLNQRMQGNDEWKLQLTPVGTAAEPAADLFVPLNSRWDAAALLRQNLFDSISDWLAFLTDFVRETPGITMAVRQHPGERYPGFEANDDWESIVLSRGNANGRIRFYGADSPANSYDLIKSAKAVLPYTSRIGIEAAMLGKPVLTSALCFYRDCGFCHSAETKTGYKEAILRAISGELPPSRESVEEAHVAYFLIENCLELKTSFTPMPGDYSQWVKSAPKSLGEEKNNRLLIDSLISRRPMGLTQYEHKYAAAL